MITQDRAKRTTGQNWDAVDAFREETQRGLREVDAVLQQAISLAQSDLIWLPVGGLMEMHGQVQQQRHLMHVHAGTFSLSTAQTP